MTTYLQFLQWLASLGPKLPAAIAAIQKIMDAVNELAGLFATRSLKKSKAAKKPTAKELAAEKALLALLPKTRGIGDGKLLAVLRQVYEFVKANPELWKLLLLAIGL